MPSSGSTPRHGHADFSRVAAVSGPLIKVGKKKTPLPRAQTNQYVRVSQHASNRRKRHRSSLMGTHWGESAWAGLGLVASGRDRGCPLIGVRVAGGVRVLARELLPVLRNNLTPGMTRVPHLHLAALRFCVRQHLPACLR
jgi:hypothetical protein